MTWIINSLPNFALSDEPFLIEKVHFEGIQQTNIRWLRDYVELNCPCSLNQKQLREIEEKLLTTQVFQSVDLDLQTQTEQGNELYVRVKEKWTTIPVIRVALGGGTPLLVAGIYDTHAFGELWTLGAEMRKYGDANPGGVVWARSPRWLNGKHYLNLELWKDRRIRNIYNEAYDVEGEILNEATMIRGDMLFPIPFSRYWQIGFHIETQDLQSTDFKIRKKTTLEVDERMKELRLNDDYSSFHKGLLRLVYDDITINELQYQGSRLIISSGPIFRGNDGGNYHEFEAYGYYLWPTGWNFAAHGFFASSSDRSLPSQQFLGGFESIRGLPDGAIFGNKAAYMNFEMRYLNWRGQNLHVQNVFFVDMGTAGSEWDSFRDDHRVSAGVGVRLSIPQVNRLVFRIDYAWSLDQYGTSGITAGMNQFFQPYRPL